MRRNGDEGTRVMGWGKIVGGWRGKDGGGGNEYGRREEGDGGGDPGSGPGPGLGQGQEPGQLGKKNWDGY